MPDDNDPGIGYASRRRVLRGTAGSLALGGLGTLGSGTALGSEHAVTLLHDTHFHGRFGVPDDDTEMDIARYQTLLDDRRAATENPVFLGIGDDLGPSLMGLAHHGEHMIEALNYVDPLAIGVGNHEFDFGIDVATDRFAESEFPWVVANLLTPGGDPIPGTERWITREVGDVTLGVFGSGVGNFHDITDYPEDYQVLDPVTASQEATDALKDAGADVVVLASHTNSWRHYDIAEAVDELDAIVGSHSDVVMDAPETVSGTVISEFGDEFAYLGELELDANGNLVDWTRHDADPAALAPDPGMADIVARWRGQLEEEFSQVFFTSETELDARFDTNYARESALGNLICDLMIEYAEGHGGLDQADVSLQNAGGIRSNSVYGPGGITGLEWLDVLPFGNTIVTMEVEGSTVHEILESQIAALPWSGFGAQQSVQVGGVQYEWSGHFFEGEVENVYVGGDPLDPDATYTFVTNSFVAGFDEFEDAEVLHESDGPMGPLFLDMLEGRTVAPGVEGRILRVDADAATPEEVVRRRGRTQLRYDLPGAIDALAGDEMFYGITQDLERFDPVRVDVEGDDLWVAFRTADLQSFFRGNPDRDLRVFGGFDPDEAYYGYEDDGELLDLPVASMWDHFVLKADVPPDAIRGPGPGRGR